MGFNIETVKNGGIYTSCIWLQGGAFLNSDAMYHCCSPEISNEQTPSNYILPLLAAGVDNNTQYNRDFFNAMYANKLELIRKINSDEPCECIGCNFLHSKYWEPMQSLQFRRLILSSDQLCNCNCTYCPQDHSKRSPYNVLDFVNGAIGNSALNINEIDYIYWVGGEPTLMADFEVLFGKLKPKYNDISTTCIKFSEQIAQALAGQDYCSLNVSIDAGTREMYAKIKGVDQFHKVIENFKKYYDRSRDKSRVSLKYILTADNCSEAEIDSFVQVIQDNKLYGTSIVVDCDYNSNGISDNIRAGMYYMALKLPLVNRKKLSCGLHLRKQMPDFATRLNVKEVGELSKIKYFFDMFLSEGSVQKDIALKLYYKVKDFYSWSRKFAHQYLHQNNYTK